MSALRTSVKVNWYTMDGTGGDGGGGGNGEDDGGGDGGDGGAFTQFSPYDAYRSDGGVASVTLTSSLNWS